MNLSINNEYYCIITVDVYCVGIENSPRYRIFVNNYLITERNFAFDQQYVRENIFVNLGPGVHTFHLESEHSGFSLKNLTVNNQLKAHGPFTNDKVISFII